MPTSHTPSIKCEDGSKRFAWLHNVVVSDRYWLQIYADESQQIHKAMADLKAGVTDTESWKQSLSLSPRRSPVPSLSPLPVAPVTPVPAPSITVAAPAWLAQYEMKPATPRNISLSPRPRSPSSHDLQQRDPCLTDSATKWDTSLSNSQSPPPEPQPPSVGLLLRSKISKSTQDAIRGSMADVITR